MPAAQPGPRPSRWAVCERVNEVGPDPPTTHLAALVVHLVPSPAHLRGDGRRCKRRLQAAVRRQVSMHGGASQRRCRGASSASTCMDCERRPGSAGICASPQVPRVMEAADRLQPQPGCDGEQARGRSRRASGSVPSRVVDDAAQRGEGPSMPCLGAPREHRRRGVGESCARLVESGSTHRETARSVPWHARGR
jgi:hypothetical protein